MAAVIAFHLYWKHMSLTTAEILAPVIGENMPHSSGKISLDTWTQE